MCQSGDAQGSCQRAINIFPAKLKDLRTTFLKVRDYFQMKDDELDTILLENSLLQDFKSSIGCQTVSEMIRFYLDDVLPYAQRGSIVIKSNVNFMKDKLLDLKQTMKRCQHFLPCDRKSKAIKQIKEKYKKLKDQGIYKAVGEFDIFVDYIEEYLNTRKK
ncbi:PREDICTED: interleukin-10 [Nanorana parkeri]|uniref:interleukin-10 n=1 Tax=Nanorana parkeri TaxID=125878 RepID=UPI0008546CF2|nr:PREDICTED: interleukin-10 [Nanorana parkeri]